MCIVLRLYPSVPLNSRVAFRDTVLPTGGGPDGRSPLFIPKGQRVDYSVYALHRRRDIYVGRRQALSTASITHRLLGT